MTMNNTQPSQLERAIGFVSQALRDFEQTLPPSARAAFAPMADDAMRVVITATQAPPSAAPRPQEAPGDNAQD